MFHLDAFLADVEADRRACRFSGNCISLAEVRDTLTSANELIAAKSDRIAAGEWAEMVQDATIEDRDRTIEILRRKYQDLATRYFETGGKAI